MALGIAIIVGLIIQLLIMIILPPFIVTLIIHFTIAKKYKNKKRWIISISTFVGLLILWLLFTYWIKGIFA